MQKSFVNMETAYTRAYYYATIDASKKKYTLSDSPAYTDYRIYCVIKFQKATYPLKENMISRLTNLFEIELKNGSVTDFTDFVRKYDKYFYTSGIVKGVYSAVGHEGNFTNWFKYFKKTNTLPVCSPDENFGNCLPEFYFKTGKDPIMKGIYDWTPEDYFMFNCLVSEWNYNHLIEEGWQAQQAAEVLPQCIKGDMIITGFEDDWKHLLDLRYYGTTGAPHPMVKELAALMKEELEKLGFNY